MSVTYQHWKEAWGSYQKTVEEIAGDPSVTSVCDVGGGANPTLSLDFIERAGLDYTLLDISPEELAKAPSGYKSVCADICDPATLKDETFDLMFSRTVAEHILNPRQFHSRILERLAPQGFAVHLFTTLYALPFVVNRLLPESVSGRILERTQTEREFSGSNAKFDAYYRWCRGPTRSQRKRLEDLGYRIVSYSGFFGHAYYRPVPILDALEGWKARQLIAHPVPLLTSYSVVTLQRP